MINSTTRNHKSCLSSRTPDRLIVQPGFLNLPMLEAPLDSSDFIISMERVELGVPRAI